MVTASLSFADLDDEFALVAETAAEVGLPGSALPPVRRGRASLPAGGDISGVFWGSGPPELVFLHDTGERPGLGRRGPSRGPAIGRHPFPGRARTSWLPSRRRSRVH